MFVRDAARRRTSTARESAMTERLEPAGPCHPCPKTRLGGRQNDLPDEYCSASTCVRAGVLAIDLARPLASRVVVASSQTARSFETSRRVASPSPSVVPADPRRSSLSHPPRISRRRKSGRPCAKRKDTSCALPFCAHHRERGDGAFRVVPHPTAGSVLVANFDVPKGYRAVFWGTRKRWRDTENKEGGDYAMAFRSNGGVIDPTTHKTGSQLQFMSCPGPNERMNMRHTDFFFGATREVGLVGRQFVVTEDVPKNHQFLIWYGSQWFTARGIDRIDVGTKRYPVSSLKRTTHSCATAAGASSAGDDDAGAGAKGTKKAKRRALEDLSNGGGKKGKARSSATATA